MTKAIMMIRSKRGQTLVEYALILAFIAVVAIVVLQALGTQIQSTMTYVTASMATSS